MVKSYFNKKIILLDISNDETDTVVWIDKKNINYDYCKKCLCNEDTKHCKKCNNNSLELEGDIKK